MDFSATGAETEARPPELRPVSAADLEALLAESLADTPDGAGGGAAGLFGPDSQLWRIDRESLIFLGVARAMLLQLAHPWVATAIARHSPVLNDPIGRFHRTFGIVFPMVFGTAEQAFAAARRLHRRHGSIAGTLAQTAGAFPAGSRYIANDPAALAWVQATLADTALLVHDSVLTPLTAAEREAYWRESRRMARLFGMRPDAMPADWAAFRARFDATVDSPVLTVTEDARRIAQALFREVPVWLRLPGWALDITAGWLPPRLRHGFGLSYGPGEQRRAERALALIRRAYPVLPPPLRLVAPYREAMARLEGRALPGAGTRLLNHVWMGRSRL